MRLLVTGGCGYVGTSLVPALLGDGHHVVVIDTEWFGNALPNSTQLQCIRGDVRDSRIYPNKEFDAVIHLANIANDPSVDLNPELSWEVNTLGTLQLLHWAKRASVKDFIYASSGSVYGLSDEPRVTENLPLLPISTYNKTKMVAEQIVSNWRDEFRVISLRPATICGYSPRMRFDLAVNLLTYQALSNKCIKVLGGAQVRPNIHIDDMVQVYRHFINDRKIPSGSYNAGFENLTILEIANRIADGVGAEITVEESNDPRSYRLDSSKLLDTGFKPHYGINDAIADLKTRFIAGTLENSIMNNTVARMLELGLGESRA
jgi:nucleoside-diphosphate-sugar epimerase